MWHLIRVFAVAALACLSAAASPATEPTKAGFVYLSSTSDHGWTYAHDLGRLMVEERFGDDVETTYVENVPEGPDATRVIRELALQGNDIIFTTSFGYMEPTLKVSREFPGVKFEHLTGYKRSPNMATANIRFHEGRYVQGVVAGMMTRTNKIGYIGAFPIAEVVMGINAFARGMRTTNPDATISVVWANTWYDPVREADITKVLIAEGADVLAQHTDSPAMLQIAEKHGAVGFAQATDNIEFAPKAQLFASINNWGPYYIRRIEELRGGAWSTGDGPEYREGDTWGGLSSGMLELSPYTNMPADAVAAAEAARKGIADGTIDIFKGPMRDNTGELVLNKGEVLDDAGLWAMDYYVEGVNGSVPN